jgi:RING finger protein 113A
MADNTAETTLASEPVVPFFKKRTKARPTNSRTRDAESTEAGPSTITAPSASEVVIPPPKKGQGFRSTLGSIQKRKLGDRNARDDDEEDERRGNDLNVNWSTLGSKARLEAGMELEAEDALAAEEELRRKRRRDENDGFDPDDDDKPIDGLYKGQKGYQTLIKKRQEVPKAARVGPQRSTNTIRTVTLVDYQPDVCKDYKGECNLAQDWRFDQ